MQKGSRSKYVPGYGVVFLPAKGFRPKHRRAMSEHKWAPTNEVQLPTTPLVPKARRAFAPAELRARLLAHRRRIVENCPPSLRKNLLGNCPDELE